MAKEINPENEAQLKKNNVVDVINGRDLDEFTWTAAAADYFGTKGQNGKTVSPSIQHKEGKVDYGHPIVVDKFEAAGWAKRTGKEIRKPMPEPEATDK